jgi:hypothetical protein
MCSNKVYSGNELNGTDHLECSSVGILQFLLYVCFLFLSLFLSPFSPFPGKVKLKAHSSMVHRRLSRERGKEQQLHKKLVTDCLR